MPSRLVMAARLAAAADVSSRPTRAFTPLNCTAQLSPGSPVVLACSAAIISAGSQPLQLSRQSGCKHRFSGGGGGPGVDATVSPSWSWVSSEILGACPPANLGETCMQQQQKKSQRIIEKMIPRASRLPLEVSLVRAHPPECVCRGCVRGPRARGGAAAARGRRPDPSSADRSRSTSRFMQHFSFDIYQRSASTILYSLEELPIIVFNT